MPDYEVDRKLWIDEHFEGSYLFRNTIIFELTPPSGSEGHWKLRYGWQDTGIAPLGKEIDTSDPSATARAKQEIDLRITEGNHLALGIPFDNPSSPGIRGTLRLNVRAWNAEALADG